MNIKKIIILSILLSSLVLLLLPATILAKPLPPVLTTEVSGNGSVIPFLSRRLLMLTGILIIGRGI